MAQRGLRYSSRRQVPFPNITNQRNHSFIHSFNKYLLSAHQVPHRVQDRLINESINQLSINQLVLMNKASSTLLMLTFHEKRQPKLIMQLRCRHREQTFGQGWGGEGEGEINGESSMDAYTLTYVKGC